MFTLGFTAGIRDLNQSQAIPDIQPPEDKPLIVLDANDHGSKATSKKPVIDTKKLLSNYNRKKMKLQVDDKSIKIVKNILQNLNLPKGLVEIFQQHEIDLEAFKLLRRADLLEMGIKNPKIIEIILSEVNKN